jgi:hypothetical protein
MMIPERLLDGMPPGFDMSPFFQSLEAQLDVTRSMPHIDFAAMMPLLNPPPEMADLLSVAATEQLSDMYSLVGEITSTYSLESRMMDDLRTLVRPAVIELLTASPDKLNELYRAKAAATEADEETTLKADDEPGGRRPSFTLTIPQKWTLAWFLVVCMYLLVWASKDFDVETVQDSTLDFAVGVMAALTAFGLFYQGKDN